MPRDSELPRLPLPDIDWSKVSDAGLWTAAQIALPRSEGFGMGEIATRLGKPRAWCTARMRALREELAALEETT